MASVTLQGLSKKFGSVAAVESLDLAIADGEFLTLLGPSGCGKSTALACIAGLERPSAGAGSLMSRRSPTWSRISATWRWCSRTTRSIRT